MIRWTLMGFGILRFVANSRGEGLLLSAGLLLLPDE